MEINFPKLDPEVEQVRYGAGNEKPSTRAKLGAGLVPHRNEVSGAGFKKVVETALNNKNKVLGAIMLKSNPFCDKIKRRKDTKIFYLEKDYNPPTTSSRLRRAPNRKKIKKRNN